MHIDDLPNDCLLLIFEEMDHLDQLLISSQVCSRWYKLIRTRLRKVTHLKYGPETDKNVEPIGKTLRTENVRLLERIDAEEVLPRLKLLDLKWSTECLCNALSNLLATGNPIKGLRLFCYAVCTFNKGDQDRRIVRYLGELEYFETNVRTLLIKYFKRFGPMNKLKRLGGLMSIEVRDFLDFAPYLTNIEQLFIIHESLPVDYPIFLYEGPVFQFVEILGYTDDSNIGIGIQLADYCPKLKSLKLDMKEAYTGFVIDSSVINYNVRELAIDMSQIPDELENFMSILKKYPNTEFLWIYTCDDLPNETLIEIIEKASNLTFCYIRQDPDYIMNEPERGVEIMDHFKSRGREVDVKFLYLEDEVKDQSIFTNESRRMFYESFYSPINDILYMF